MLKDSVENNNYGKVCVLGWGMTGQAVTEYLSPLIGQRVEELTVYTGRTEIDGITEETLKKAGVKVIHGEEVTGRFDLCVASPGIPFWSGFYRSARQCCCELISEPELAFRENGDRWIGVTGTSGKTTVVALLTSIIRSSGQKAMPAGNEWYPIVSEKAVRPADAWLIAELSHSQLINAPSLHPRVAVLTNISEDHQDWHRSMEAYAKAKEQIFANLGNDDLAILCSDDPFCRKILKALDDAGLRVCFVGDRDCGRENAAFTDNGRLMVRLNGHLHGLIHSSQLKLPGECNRIDALAAAAAACEIGIGDEDIRNALQAFKPFEHRNVPLGTAYGIQFIDNAKSGNPAKAEAAIRMYQPGRLVLIAGGNDTGVDIRSLTGTAANICTGVAVFGPAGPRFAEGFHRAADGENAVLKEIFVAASLEEAFHAAVKMASPGQTILLSPGEKWAPEFKSVFEEGELFEQLVTQLKQKERNGAHNR